MNEVIAVVGNTHSGTTPTFTLQEFKISWNDPASITVESSSAGKPELATMVQSLQPILLYRLLEPIHLHVPTLNGNDVILRDPRVFIGLAAVPPFSSDISRVRDIILEHELATGSQSRMRELRGSAPLLYAVEHLIRAILTQATPLSELYKAIEAIEEALGGRSNFPSIGIDSSYVKFITKRANMKSDDQRHAPSDPASISPTPASELRECVVRTRKIICSYAKAL